MAKLFVPELQLLQWSDEWGPRNLKWRMLKRKLSVYQKLCFNTLFSLRFPNILNVHVCPLSLYWHCKVCKNSVVSVLHSRKTNTANLSTVCVRTVYHEQKFHSGDETFGTCIMLLFQIISLFQNYVYLTYVTLIYISQEVSGNNIISWEYTAKPPYEFPTISINNMVDVRKYKGKAKLAPSTQALWNDMQYLLM